MVGVKLRVVSPWAYLNWLVFPILFASVGLFVLSASPTPGRMVYGVLGGGIIGYWSVAYIDGGNSIQDERWNGTLEHIMAVPTPLPVVILGKITGSLTMGMLAFIPSAVLAYVGFHAFLPGLDAGAFAISFLVLTFTFFSVAMMLTPFFAIWRWAFTMLNGFELGVYVLCGFMFPTTQLPLWAQDVAAALAPTWATRALYASATPGAEHDYLAWWGASIGLSIAYLGLSVLFYRFVEARARVSGSLALA